MYKLIRLDGILHNIEKTSLLGTKIIIPLDEANTDYQEYLEWVADGNTPEEAE
jgi:hypothetical protein